MKILGMFSSPRGLGSNSGFLLGHILDEAEKKGHAVDRLDLTRLDIQACTGCRTCWTNEERACIIDDDYHVVADAITEADYLFMATPLYYWWVSPALKMTLDRSYPPPFEKFAGKTMHMVITGIEPPENQCFVGIKDGFTAMCKFLGAEFKYFYTVAEFLRESGSEQSGSHRKGKGSGGGSVRTVACRVADTHLCEQPRVIQVLPALTWRRLPSYFDGYGPAEACPHVPAIIELPTTSLAVWPGHEMKRSTAGQFVMSTAVQA